MDADAACDRLRALVQDCIAKHLYSSAVFYADKLVTLSGHAPGDVFLLAQTFYVSEQYRRAHTLLRNHGLMDDMRFRYLAAKCMAQVQEWDECLALLGDTDLGGGDGGDASDDDGAMLVDGAQQRGPAAAAAAAAAGAGEVALAAAVALLRGQVYEALGNRGRARRWYKAALLRDAYCEAAFSALIGGHMLTGDEELALVDALHLPPSDQWLRLLYRCRCKKYGQADSMDAQLGELERPAASSSGAGAGAGDWPDAPPTQPQPLQQQQGAAQQENQHTPAAARATRSKLKQRQASGQPPDAAAEMDVLESPPPAAAAPRAGGGAAAAAAEDGAPASPGWGLGANVDVMAARAEWAYHVGDFDRCYALTGAVLARDAYATEVLPAHLAAAVQLGRKNDLFLRGHRLVEEYPRLAISWFAVGCYYTATRQHDAARRYFARATQVDGNCAPAWVGLGHAFAAQDEADQAMGAYRTAARLFPGLAAPLLGMGAEYARMNNLALAERCFAEAHRLCPGDAAVAHEMGVLCARNRQLAAAAGWLRRALELAPPARPLAAEPTLVALAHVLRKQGAHDEAAELLERALGLEPTQAGTWSALAYTRLLAGDSAAAVEGFHRALALRPDDGLSAALLAEALQHECARFSAEIVAGADGAGGMGALAL